MARVHRGAAGAVSYQELSCQACWQGQVQGTHGIACEGWPLMEGRGKQLHQPRMQQCGYAGPLPRCFTPDPLDGQFAAPAALPPHEHRSFQCLQGQDGRHDPARVHRLPHSGAAAAAGAHAQSHP